MRGALSIGTAPLLCVMGVMKICTEVEIDRAELERRVADYASTAAFQEWIVALASTYREIGLPVPPYEVLWSGEIDEVRKCMEALMAQGAKGALEKEPDDPKEGAGSRARRCGVEEYLRR